MNIFATPSPDNTLNSPLRYLPDLWAHFLRYAWVEGKARLHRSFFTPPKADPVKYHVASHLNQNCGFSRNRLSSRPPYLAWMALQLTCRPSEITHSFLSSPHTNRWDAIRGCFQYRSRFPGMFSTHC